jgi:hypothetical protein
VLNLLLNLLLLLLLLLQGQNGLGRGSAHCQGGYSSQVTQEGQEAQEGQEQET